MRRNLSPNIQVSNARERARSNLDRVNENQFISNIKSKGTSNIDTGDLLKIVTI